MGGEEREVGWDKLGKVGVMVPGLCKEGRVENSLEYKVQSGVRGGGY